MPVLALDGVLRRYDWGSPTAIPEMLGLEPDGRPAAELWFGAHPDDPCAVPTRGTTLDQVIGDDPQTAMGAAVVERFGPRLPFLVKVLAAAKPLSIQVHPTLDQARTGKYGDRNHKPELLCALTEFEALCGFRPVPETLRLLGALAVPELRFVQDALHDTDPLRAAFRAVLRHPDPGPLVAVVAERVAEVDEPALRGVRLAAEDFPTDIGVVLALLLNHVRLEPGAAIYLAAGTLHSYLRGTGVEIMANSDSVLRCGLTAKHIDLPAVLEVTGFSALDEPQWPDVGGAFEVPVPDFRLVRQEIDEPTALADDGPCIVLCTSGSVRVGGVALSPGRAAFVPAGEPTTIDGAGVAFAAGVGRLR